jgi:hypothetical protein
VTTVYTVSVAGYYPIVRPILLGNGVAAPKIIPIFGQGGEQTFTVSIVAGQVSDVQGSTVAAGELGTFTAVVPASPVPVLNNVFGTLTKARSAHGATSSHHRRHHHRYGHTTSHHRRHHAVTTTVKRIHTAGGAVS